MKFETFCSRNAEQDLNYFALPRDAWVLEEISIEFSSAERARGFLSEFLGFWFPSEDAFVAERVSASSVRKQQNFGAIADRTGLIGDWSSSFELRGFVVRARRLGVVEIEVLVNAIVAAACLRLSPLKLHFLPSNFKFQNLLNKFWLCWHKGIHC